jgi:hypothetical protein
MISLHFIEGYFCHQDTKTQRIECSKKIFLGTFESLWQFSGLSGLGIESEMEKRSALTFYPLAFFLYPLTFPMSYQL